MAEIRVEHKDNKPIWPWILGLLLLAGLIWGVAELLEDDEPEMEMARTEEVVQEPVLEQERVRNEALAAGPIAAFVTFTEEDGEMGLDHQYTSEGIEKLRAALVALADEQGAGDANISQKKETLNMAADKIQKDPQSLQHANSIKDAFMASADLMDALQEKNFPDLNSDVEEVREAAQAIDAKTPTLEQKDNVKKFFDEAGNSLQAMNMNTVNQ